jgi:diguanylate cyclase (GGDEF)-like protein
MIRLFDSMYRAPTPLLHPTFDIEQLSITLFAMGFGRDFISACKYRYYWDFQWLFPALHDGSFYGRRAGGCSSGQGDLRGFAVFLCGAFVQHSELRTRLNVLFEESLLKDGYRFDGRSLVEINMDTSVLPELSKLQNRESLMHDVSFNLRDASCVAVVFIDVDDFKEVNDQLSHTQGDECLAKVAQTISDVLRHRGKLYRVGGDEFCAMLPNCCADEARATAERIRKSVDSLEPFGGKVKVTVSLGVAVSDRAKLSAAKALVTAADEAMYVSKFTTKNRVCMWPPGQEEAAQATVAKRQHLGQRRK